VVSFLGLLSRLKKDDDSMTNGDLFFGNYNPADMFRVFSSWMLPVLAAWIL